MTIELKFHAALRGKSVVVETEEDDFVEPPTRGAALDSQPSDFPLPYLMRQRITFSPLSVKRRSVIARK